MFAARWYLDVRTSNYSGCLVLSLGERSCGHEKSWLFAEFRVLREVYEPLFRFLFSNVRPLPTEAKPRSFA